MAVDARGNLYIADFFQVLEVSHTPLVAAGPRLVLTGSVKILGTRYVFGLTPAHAALARGGSATLTLGFPAAAQKRFSLLLKPGQRAQATISVRPVDKAGHACTSTRTIAIPR